MDNIEVHKQDGFLLIASSLSVSVIGGQQPIALEDKQMFLERPWHAQPEKRVTSAESDAGAAFR